VINKEKFRGVHRSEVRWSEVNCCWN
jgi:hypothetical protein